MLKTLALASLAFASAAFAQEEPPPVEVDIVGGGVRAGTVVAVPAIPTEGRALWDAVVAQGVAGVLARQRSSPYLPGVRSRLWRFIAAAPGVVGQGGEGPDEEAAARPAAAPVLALIERLPLDLGE